MNQIGFMAANFNHFLLDRVINCDTDGSPYNGGINWGDLSIHCVNNERVLGTRDIGHGALRADSCYCRDDRGS